MSLNSSVLGQDLMKLVECDFVSVTPKKEPVLARKHDDDLSRMVDAIKSQIRLFEETTTGWVTS